MIVIFFLCILIYIVSISQNNWYYLIAQEEDNVFDLITSTWDMKPENANKKKTKSEFGRTCYSVIQSLQPFEKEYALHKFIADKSLQNTSQFKKFVEGYFMKSRLLIYMREVFSQEELDKIPNIIFEKLFVTHSEVFKKRNKIVTRFKKGRTKFGTTKQELE